LQDLPIEDIILRRLDLPSLGALERTSSTLRDVSRLHGNLSWKLVTTQRWGPVRLPTCWAAYSARKIVPNWSGPETCPADWRALLCYLETVIRTWLCISVRKAVMLLECQGVLEPTTSTHRAKGCGTWHETLRQLLTWVPLSEKRRLAAFVCADWQPPTTLGAFLAPIPIQGASPVVALRDLLLCFPFLPIDAGQGADRVIGYFSRAYVIQNVASLHALGLGFTGETDSQAVGAFADASDGSAQPAAPLVAGESDDEEYLQEGMENHETLTSELTGLSPAEARTARDAVYTLTYAVIMLNTDLHNPAISPKMSAHEYVQSCHRCIPLRNMPADSLLAIYQSIVQEPLQIAPAVDGVDSTIRCSQLANDTESGAIYSIYSALPHRAAAAATLAHGTPASGGNLSVSSTEAPLHARALPVDSNGQGVTRREGSADTGGLRSALSRWAAWLMPPQPDGQPLPAVDWAVAYYNLVDAMRYARAAVVRNAPSRRLWLSSSALIAMSLLYRWMGSLE